MTSKRSSTGYVKDSRWKRSTVIAMESGELEESRAGKEVWRGEWYLKREGITEPLRIVFRVSK